jgi:hypothetical protein
MSQGWDITNLIQIPFIPVRMDNIFVFRGREWTKTLT